MLGWLPSFGIIGKQRGEEEEEEGEEEEEKEVGWRGTYRKGALSAR